MNKKLFISMSGLAVLLVAGCGTPNLTGAQPSTATTKTTASGSSGVTADNSSAQVPSSSTNATTSQTTTSLDVTQSQSGAVKQQHIYLSVLPGGKLGPDGKKHDAFSPSDFTIVEGVPVTVTIYNFDDMQHSLTSSSLGLNVQATPSKKDGDPGVTTVTFTPTKAGDFEWRCIDPCDLENNQWAMSQEGFMKGTIHVVPNQQSKTQDVALTVLPGGKLGPDGKKHDAFLPANFTLVPGVPVKLTIYNYDDMRHSITSPGLNLNIQANPSKKDGQPGVTSVTFTPSKTGNFNWNCIDPCDISNGQWAMFHNGYMTGTITVSDNPTSASQADQTSGSNSNTSNNNDSGYGGMVGGSSGMMGGSSGLMNGQYGGSMGGSGTGSGMGSMMGGGTSR